MRGVNQATAEEHRSGSVTIRKIVAPLVGLATADMPAFSPAARAVCWHVVGVIAAILPGAALQAGVFGETGGAAW
jgi:hypothetical protein